MMFARSGSCSTVLGLFGVLAFIAGASGCGAGYQYNRSARRYGGDIAFTLINDTPFDVCYVRMSPSTDNRWGDDWLGPHEVIHPGVARTFAIRGGPAWDVNAQTCNHEILGQATQIPLMVPFQLAVSQLGPGLRVIPVGVAPAGVAPVAQP